jgi:TonB-dependent SusC/RagA subfamily outer membrane receptor
MTHMPRALLPILVLLAACSHHNTSQVADPSKPPGTVLTADDIRRSPGQTLEQLLLARVPGLTITRAADGRTVLRLRGANTFIGQEEPLIVVNDLELGPSVAGNLSAIDVHDIETVQVLRDAAATAAYGVRGANGVIIIRTKTT